MAEPSPKKQKIEKERVVHDGKHLNFTVKDFTRSRCVEKTPKNCDKICIGIQFNHLDE